MKLPVSIAQKLLQLMQGTMIPAAQLKHGIVDKMVSDGVLQKQRTGSNRNVYFLRNPGELNAYLLNQFGVADLQAYVEGYNKVQLTRSEAIAISSDSKLKSIRTFKGFLVNSFEAIETTLNGERLVINPTKGTFQFIYDFETFVPAGDVVIAGVENAENFSNIHLQRSLFAGRKILFISRYPQSQSGDIMRWLTNIPNHYLHFGDFDFEGIHIYLREYKKHLGERATFFVPDAIDSILPAKGNRDLYNKQLHHQPDPSTIDEAPILHLLQLVHQYKKVLEQEALIGS